VVIGERTDVKLHRLLLLSFAACGSSPAPAVSNAATPGAGTAATLPGPCVDATRDASDRLVAHFHVRPEARSGFLQGLAHQQMDLDGDGTLDAIFADSPTDTPWSVLYVVRDSCAHFVGEAAGTISSTGSRSGGWLDLVTSENRAALHFDGTAYRTR
jgi:hypothetical protein